MDAIHAYYEGNSEQFLALNGALWSPAGTFWNALIPADAQDPADTSPAYGFKAGASMFDANASYKKKFNASAGGAAPLLVRDAPVQVGN